MIKHVIPVIAAFPLLLPSAYAMRGEEVEISVTVGGEKLVFEDQKPVIINGRTLIPVRSVMEALGAQVEWRDEEKSAVVTKGDVALTLVIGENTMRVGSDEMPLDAAPMILNGRTILPIRAVAEAFGARVQWDEGTKTVIIE